MRARVEVLESRIAPAAAFAQFADPHPAAGNQFGATILTLSTGNVVVTAPGDDTGGVDAGAVYLFNGATGALISELRGSTAGDQIGSNGVTALGNGNFVVRSGNWDNGAAQDAGAVTWGSGTTGVSGVVSASNSLVGTTAFDNVGGSAITVLSSGNYLVISTNWDNGGTAQAGAVTWGSGTTGVKGVVSASNSLVGTSPNDLVGSGGVTQLSNGHYVVRSQNWDNGSALDAGAVTWGNGSTGVTGTIGASNSLIGSSTNDAVGSSGITLLTNGNYLVRSAIWGASDFGAVTWGSATSGVVGVVSATNSLVGSSFQDSVGNSVTALSNGNYVVVSANWDNAGSQDAGAVTWGNGTTGTTGVVSATNSLVGSVSSSNVGSGGITVLSNGNYIVASPNWDATTSFNTSNVGAVTWGNGSSGISGVVSATNSLVGSVNGDNIGSGGIVALSTGNFVVRSPGWDNGSQFNAGAVTWGNGTSGTTGAVSAANSLVGSTSNDSIGGGSITALSNGNYVVVSSGWDNGPTADAGAVTFGNGATGVSGAVAATNSLVGTAANSLVGNGGVIVLANGNYVVRSQNWSNGSVSSAGAVTWGSGTVGVSGPVSATNSLIGSSSNDNVGDSVTPLSSGNYVVISQSWDNANATNAGAVTFGNGSTGVTGVISATNSLVGGTASSSVGSGGVTLLSNGNYVVRSSSWDNGTIANAGAVTWGSGSSGVSGVVSATNSLIGSAANDAIGNNGVVALSNGNYVISSVNWDNGAMVDAGAVTWGSGTTGVKGAVNATNSLVGSSSSDIVGNNGVTVLSNGNYVVNSSSWDNGTTINTGAVTWGNGTGSLV